jgi:hypothetical protein
MSNIMYLLQFTLKRIMLYPLSPLPIWMFVIGYTRDFSSAYYLAALSRRPLRILKLWDVIPCHLVNRYRCLESASYFQLRDKQVRCTTLKMETVRTSKTSVNIYQSTGHPTPEWMNLQLLNIIIHTDVCDVAIG